MARPLHARNFLDCVKSRARCTCDIETGHRSTTAALIANIALRTQALLEWDAKAERFTNNDGGEPAPRPELPRALRAAGGVSDGRERRIATPLPGGGHGGGRGRARVRVEPRRGRPRGNRCRLGHAGRPAPRLPSASGKLCFFTKPLPALDWRRTVARRREGARLRRPRPHGPAGRARAPGARRRRPPASRRGRTRGRRRRAHDHDGAHVGRRPDRTPDPGDRGAARDPVFKAGYYLYESEDVRADVDGAGRDFARLVALAAACGIQAGFHNHSAYVGAALWDAAPVRGPARGEVGRLLLRPAPRIRGGRRRSVEVGGAPRRAAARDDRGEGLPLGQGRRGLEGRERPARRGHGRLGRRARDPARPWLLGTDLGPPRVRARRRGHARRHASSPPPGATWPS